MGGFLMTYADASNAVRFFAAASLKNKFRCGASNRQITH